MLGANGIGTPAVATGQIAAVSAGYGSVTIARQSQPNIGAVTAGISGSATTSAVTGNVSMAIASLGQAWSRKNVTIGQAGVGKQVTDSFVNMAYAMLVGIGLVYLIMVVLLGSLRVPLVILFALLVFLVTFFALPLAVIGAFDALALTGRERAICPRSSAC